MLRDHNCHSFHTPLLIILLLTNVVHVRFFTNINRSVCVHAYVNQISIMDYMCLFTCIAILVCYAPGCIIVMLKGLLISNEQSVSFFSTLVAVGSSLENNHVHLRISIQFSEIVIKLFLKRFLKKCLMSDSLRFYDLPCNGISSTRKIQWLTR